MIPKWQWILTDLFHRLWFRASLLGLLGVATALVALVAGDLIPEDFPAEIGAEAVDNILSILASSMLAVTTFSLSIMVVAYGNATTHATPRASRLLAEDPTMQNALATFIGSFLFSLVGLIALSAGAYGGAGRVVLFAATMFVVLLIVIAIVRWSDYLTSFGRLGETTSRVEKATAEALKARAEAPTFQARILAKNGIPPMAIPVQPDKTGYIEHVDVAKLSNWAEKHDSDVYLASLPGALVHPGGALVHVEGRIEEDSIDGIRQAFSIGEQRDFDQDPRFGLSVLCEIASRALSPSVNDPGTAIDVIGRALRLLLQYHADCHSPDTREIEYKRVHVPPLQMRDLFDDIFTPIGRDGADIVEVHVRLQKALAALADTGDPELVENAERHSRLALQRAEAALRIEPDRALLRALAEKVAPAGRAPPTPPPAIPV